MGRMIDAVINSVQTWECDAMGHLNVRFYSARAHDALVVLGMSLGVTPARSRSDGILLEPEEQHIRFLREQRPGAPLVGRAGVLAVEGDALHVLIEIVDRVSGEVAANFITAARIVDAKTRRARTLPDEVRERAAAYFVRPPDNAGPRGLRSDPPRQDPMLTDAEAMGLIPTYQGVVNPAECDDNGFMTICGYMGRVSDAIPNLIAATRGDDRGRDERIGGAALEYRIVYRRRPRLGDILTLRSGLRDVRGKTYTWGHWMFDVETGTAVATAEAIAISMDLVERRAVEIPPETRMRLEERIIPGLVV